MKFNIMKKTRNIIQNICFIIPIISICIISLIAIVLLMLGILSCTEYIVTKQVNHINMKLSVYGNMITITIILSIFKTEIIPFLKKLRADNKISTSRCKIVIKVMYMLIITNLALYLISAISFFKMITFATIAYMMGMMLLLILAIVAGIAFWKITKQKDMEEII